MIISQLKILGRIECGMGEGCLFVDSVLLSLFVKTRETHTKGNFSAILRLGATKLLTDIHKKK